nr:G5 and 3D domain-containing protein [Ectobacillus ponti]
MVISSSVGTAAYAGTQDEVTIEVEGKQQVVHTHADTVKELLEKQNIKLVSKDKVSPGLDAKVKDHMKIMIDKADRFAITVDGEKQELLSTAKTVDELLKERNIQLGEHDVVKPGRGSALKGGENITVEHAFMVSLTVGGQQQQVWSTSITVADLLKKQQVALNELDKVQPSLETIVKKDTAVAVVKVEKVTDVVEVDVPFAEVKKQDPNMDAGTQQVLQQGEAGKLQRTFEVVKENGAEVSRTLQQEVKLKESKERIVAVGTRAVASAAPDLSSRGEGNVVKEFYVEATSYSPYCGGCEGTSAGGYNYKANPNMKLIAVDPRLIPLGTKVWVEGYGYAVAGDTGGAIKGYRIDVLMPTEAQASAWGRKRVKIRILG